MATYVIGDIQGCYRTLLGLLARIHYQPQRDMLWFTGDLVNRGAQSLKVLRWAIDQGDRVITVLGNHELHLLGVAAGLRQKRKDDTLESILGASDRDDLLTWLRHRPLMHRDHDMLLVHAGLLPHWTTEEALALAHAAEQALRGPDWQQCLALYFGNPMPTVPPTPDALRVAHAMQALTRLRVVTLAGEMMLNFNGPPSKCPQGTVPWYDAPGRRSLQQTIAFGHWAALGLLLRPNLIACDTGCVWGNALTAVRLEDRAVFQEPA